MAKGQRRRRRDAGGPGRVGGPSGLSGTARAGTPAAGQRAADQVSGPGPARRLATGATGTAAAVFAVVFAASFAYPPDRQLHAGAASAVTARPGTTPAAWTATRMAAATSADSPAPAATTPAAAFASTPADTPPAVRPTPSPTTPPAPAPTTPPPASAPVPASTPASLQGPQTAHPFAGTPAVGVLFYTDQSLQDHYCTASVVHSPAGDLVVTAAHCVYGSGYKTGIAFVPGYHDGQSPYGQWTPTHTIVSQSWMNSGNPDEDVAFLVMAKSPAGAAIESVTGANQIAFGQGFGQLVTVPAYPQGQDTPITCESPTIEFSSTQTQWNCAGYPDGTSGAPFVAGGTNGANGVVVGVIGGYQEGGDTPDISYSAYFGPAVARLYQTAEAAG